MVSNKYSFENQINKAYKVSKIPNSSSTPIEAPEYEKIKNDMRKQIYSNKNFRVNVDDDLFMEEIPIGDQVVKRRGLSEQFIGNEAEYVKKNNSLSPNKK